MSIKFCWLVLSLHVIAGCVIAASLAPFFGDASNFYNYAKTIETVSDFLTWNGLQSFQNLNVFFVSYLYVDTLRAVLINSIVSLLFVVAIFFNDHFRKFVRFNQYSRVYALPLFVFFAPALVFRFGEPSREYIQSICLFLGGFFYGDGSLPGRAFVSLFIAAIVRPVAAPIFFLWLAFFGVYKRRLHIRLLSLVLFVFLMLIGRESSLVSFYYQKVVDYGGLLGADPNFALKATLNVFGDLNSFLTTRYSTIDRCFFFLDYIWRIVFMAVLFRRGGWLTLQFIVFSAVIVAVVYPFPHPRYFVPSLFFLAGYLQRKFLSGAGVELELPCQVR